METILPIFGSIVFYGFVDHKDADFNIALLGNFKLATINSAKSSGCKTFSVSPSVNFKSIDMSDAIVEGIKVQTRILFLRTSRIKESDKPITPKDRKSTRLNSSHV